jgi:hypothetical protein
MEIRLIGLWRDWRAVSARIHRGGENHCRHDSANADRTVQPNVHVMEESKLGAYSPSQP